MSAVRRQECTFMQFHELLGLFLESLLMEIKWKSYRKHPQKSIFETEKCIPYGREALKGAARRYKKEGSA